MSGRDAALKALLKVTEGSAYNTLALKDTLKNEKNLDNRQKALATELVNGTLRHLTLLDFYISSFSGVAVKKMKPVILTTLRLAVYQMMFTDKIPDYAVIDEAVEQVKRMNLGGLAGFVNAVLRAVQRGAGTLAPPDISVKYSVPEWIINYWSKSYDYDTITAICAAAADRPRVGLCVNTLKTDRERLIKILENEGVYATAGGLSKNCLYAAGVSDVTELTSYKDGLFHVMGEASMAAVEALAPEPGDTVSDVCASPGGKTAYMAALMQDTGVIRAYDIYGHKIKLIQKTAERLGFTNIHAEIKDAETGVYPPADRMLADVPCSGLGILNKKPDIKYTLTMEKIEALAVLQKNILANVSKYVKTNGVLVYSTCTVSEKENAGITGWFTDNHPYRLERATELLPGAGGADGFYIAKFVRL